MAKSAHDMNRRLRTVGEAANRVFASFAPSFRPYGLTPNRGKLCRQLPHSHSIVAGTYKDLTLLVFFQAYNELTVRPTVKQIRLSAIDGDRCRKGKTSER
jgi:hypothetical protein